MPKFCANLSMMFTEVPFLDRFDAAARAGFEAVEFLFPYEHPPAALRARLDGAGLSQVLFNAPPGRWDLGERGTAGLPGRRDEFRDGVLLALDYAAALGCGLVHVMAGIPPAGVSPVTSLGLYVANLAWAAERAAEAGVRLLIEPINPRDMPGYLLNTTSQAAAVIGAVAGLGLQFDIYHCQVSEGDIVRRMEALLPIIGHMQVADVPDRHEPGTGEIGWAHVFARMDGLGYASWVGCEYRPAGETLAGLAAWRGKFGI